MAPDTPFGGCEKGSVKAVRAVPGDCGGVFLEPPRDPRLGAEMYDRNLRWGKGVSCAAASALVFGAACGPSGSPADKPSTEDAAVTRSAVTNENADALGDSTPSTEPAIPAKVADSLGQQLGSLPAQSTGETLPEPARDPHDTQSVSLDDGRPTSRSEAWKELRALHAAGVERQLAQLSKERRTEVEEYYESLGKDPHDLAVYFTGAGTPAALPASGFDISPQRLGLSRDATEGEIARAFVHRYAAIWGIDPQVVSASRRRVQHSSMGKLSMVDYSQRYRQLPVRGAGVRVLVGGNGAVRGAIGSFLPSEELRGVNTQPSIAAEAAATDVEVGKHESRGSPELVIHSDFMSGGKPDARLAWEVPVHAASGGMNEKVYVDAHEGSVFARNQLARQDLRRSVWDQHSTYNSGSCKRWREIDGNITRPIAQGGFDPSDCAITTTECQQCRNDVSTCPLCACEGPNEPEPNCETEIWRYDDRSMTQCISDGVPSGEPDCGTQAQQWWDVSQEMYNFWQSRFGRDSWNNQGGYLFTIANAPDVGAAAVTRPAQHLDADGILDTVLAASNPVLTDGDATGAAMPHEFGHMLQFGIPVPGSPTEFEQGSSVLEHNADIQSYSFREVNYPEAFSCTVEDDIHPSHYTEVWTNSQDPGANLAHPNDWVGNCHGWLLAQDDQGTVEHYGVDVTPLNSLADYDQIWFRALQMHREDHSYFQWWNNMVDAAVLETFFGSIQHIKVNQAFQAIGGWTRIIKADDSVTVKNLESPAATARAGTTHGPCVFYRHDVDPADTIYVKCWNQSTNSFTQEAIVNDPIARPAGAAPSAATIELCDASGCTNWAFAFWPQRSNGQIMVRGIDLSNLTFGLIGSLGSAHRSHSFFGEGRWRVAAGAVDDPATNGNRGVVVYHHADFPAQDFRYTMVDGLTTLPHADMGSAFDSEAVPSMTSYPYPDRVYFVRANDSSDAEPFRLEATSFPGGSHGVHPDTQEGWRSPTNLTTLLSPSDDDRLHEDSGSVPANIVRSSPLTRVALTQYGRTASEPRLRMMYTPSASGDCHELWYATMSEESPGVLTREATIGGPGQNFYVGGYWPVPVLNICATTTRSVGALATDPAGFPLWHFFGGPPSSAQSSPVLSQWRTFSD